MIEVTLLGFCSIVAVLFVIRTLLQCTIKICTSNVTMKDKVIIVTGANSGIGLYTAMDLAARGGRVILACRDEARATASRDYIVALTRNENVVYKHLDLSSLQSVRDFAEDIKNSETKLDVLVNNAGVYLLNESFTEDGIIEGMQVNHFAPFLLTVLLMPLLKKAKGRVVNVSSLCYLRGEVKFDKINKAGAYNAGSVYGNSKLCNILFTKELARRTYGTGVITNAVHPGAIFTNIVKRDSLLSYVGFKALCWIYYRTPEEGAQTSIYLSVADEVKNVSGKFFMDCQKWFVVGAANDEGLAKDLWEYSAELVGWQDGDL